MRTHTTRGLASLSLWCRIDQCDNAVSQLLRPIEAGGTRLAEERNKRRYAEAVARLQKWACLILLDTMIRGRSAVDLH
jgi:hypothetical protein